MELYNSEGKCLAVTHFNKRHLNKVRNLKWSLSSTGHVINATYNILLHQLIKGKKEGYEIDHKNNIKLNNLDSNLRFATHQQNCWNRKTMGAYWDKEKKKWVARLNVNGKKVLFKRYIKKTDAIKARKQAEKKYFGEFAYKGGD